MNEMCARLRKGFGTAAGYRSQAAAYQKACNEAADEIDRLRTALNIAVLAMRAPIDDWKGEVERKALDVARDVLSPNEKVTGMTKPE